MPVTVSIILDDDLARRLERFAAERGFDRTGALDHALRCFLDDEERAGSARDAIVAAARHGDGTSGPDSASHHDDIRRWLLSWGGNGERKRPRSC